MRWMKALLATAARFPELREDKGPRTYAALAGDGLMPEMMPPLAPEEHQNNAPTNDDALDN